MSYEIPKHCECNERSIDHAANHCLNKPYHIVYRSFGGTRFVCTECIMSDDKKIGRVMNGEIELFSDGAVK